MQHPLLIIFFFSWRGGVDLFANGILLCNADPYGPLIIIRLAIAFLYVRCPYIFLIYYYITIYVCVPHFYDLSAMVGCWPSVSKSLYKKDYLQIFHACPFDYTAVAVSGKVDRS